MVARWLTVTLCCVLLIAVSMVKPVAAQTDDMVQVGVVIQARGATTTYCVTLPASRANGLAALEATGVDLAAERGPIGATVCRVNNLGCTPPAEACFCQCQGSLCNYWSYFYQTGEGGWRYSGIGALQHTLKTGDVEGWLWNEGNRMNNGNVTPAVSLTAIRFEDICHAGSGVMGADRPSSAIDAGTLGGFGIPILALLGIGGVLIWRRRRSS